MSLPEPVRTLVLATVLAAGALLSGAARAAPDAVPLLETWLLPRYDALTATTARQEQAWRTFCAKPGPEGIGTLSADFRAVADAWAQVSFVTFGPVILALRADRFNMFPDKRNAVSRSIPELLADPDETRLQPDRFGRLSAAVQGLPALERVLFEPDAAPKLVAGDDAARRCALGTAIALNLATIAKDIRAGWGDKTTGLLAEVKSGKGDKVFLPDPAQVPSLVVTDLAGAYQRVVDLGLIAVLGKSVEEAKPLAGEGRRSGREAEILRQMVRSANALGSSLAAGLPEPARGQVLARFAAAQKAVDALPADLGAAAADPKRRKLLETAVTEVKAAQKAVVDPLAAKLGVPLGFNALDGD
ncbi:imelysin family protein [Xanthobacter sp. DSM 24535]|uniref:imelysin family protein n=1 Tax=Roseixanthobacter psychrophilus TaxID=3119917 RepID=UPI00372B81DF